MNVVDHLGSRSSRGGLAVLCLVIAIAWAYLVWMSWGMDHMDVEMVLMPAMTNWQPLDLLLVWVMWALMMAGINPGKRLLSSSQRDTLCISTPRRSPRIRPATTGTAAQRN